MWCGCGSSETGTEQTLKYVLSCDVFMNLNTVHRPVLVKRAMTCVLRKTTAYENSLSSLRHTVSGIKCPCPTQAHTAHKEPYKRIRYTLYLYGFMLLCDTFSDTRSQPWSQPFSARTRARIHNVHAH